MNEPSYHLEGIVRTRSEEMEDFNGPLDVILLLLSKNKIAIEDVSIAAILEQYLAYLDEMKRLDMEIASEFITMASHLMVIKTKMLLSASEQAEAESEMELLRQSLVERQRKEALEQIRQAVQFLEARNEVGRGMFTKEPEPRPKENTYGYQHEPEDLCRALAAIAERSRPSAPTAGNQLPGHCGQGTLSGDPEGEGSDQASGSPRSHAPAAAVPGLQEPVGGGGHIFGGAGAVPYQLGLADR